MNAREIISSLSAVCCDQLRECSAQELDGSIAQPKSINRKKGLKTRGGLRFKDHIKKYHLPESWVHPYLRPLGCSSAMFTGKCSSPQQQGEDLRCSCQKTLRPSEQLVQVLGKLCRRVHVYNKFQADALLLPICTMPCRELVCMYGPFGCWTWEVIPKSGSLRGAQSKAVSENTNTCWM